MELIPTLSAINSALKSPIGQAVIQTVANRVNNSLVTNKSKKNNSSNSRRRNRTTSIRNPNPRTVIMPELGIAKYRSEGKEPNIRTTNKGITVISHTEVLGTVTSQGPDGDTSCLYPISCKMTNYLLETAHRFQKFKLTSMSFTYETICTTGTHGRVIVAPCYDGITIEQVEAAGLNYLGSWTGAKTCSVWMNDLGVVTYDLRRVTNDNLWWDCHPSNNGLDPATNIENILGYLIVKNSGAGDVDLGIIHVNYTFEFAAFKPSISPDVILRGYIPIVDPHEELVLNGRIAKARTIPNSDSIPANTGNEEEHVQVINQEVTL